MNNHKITIYQNPNCFQQGNIAQGFTKAFCIQHGETDELTKAVSFDNCPAQYKNGHRKGENFIQANCILADIDNSHSDNSTEWITHDDVISALPGVMFYYYPSRNHMKIKNGKSARPKEHYIFPTDIITDANAYAMLPRMWYGVFYCGTLEIRRIKCDADEHRRRGLDRADPLFSFPKEMKMQTNLQRFFYLFPKLFVLSTNHTIDNVCNL